MDRCCSQVDELEFKFVGQMKRLDVNTYGVRMCVGVLPCSVSNLITRIFKAILRHTRTRCKENKPGEDVSRCGLISVKSPDS